MDFEKLAQAMGDLDEDTVVEMLEAVMEDGGSEADKAMEACQKGPKTKMILCTVKDDLHDIGKNIVRAMLEAAGFDVIDLGIDVDPEKVVEVAKEQNIKIVALSGVLTLALDSMKDTVDAIRNAGLDCKIIIGGAPVSEEACAAIGADEWAHSPQKTINVCKAWAAELA